MLFLKIFIYIWIINLFFSRQKGVLACGLIGYCGNTPADPYKIRLLQLYNLKRGGDAAGIYIGNEVFKDAIPANKFLAEKKEVYDLIPEAKNFTVIGHDRQASVGSRDKAELAHPYDVQGTNTRLILAHNGTIHNILELAKKHGVEHTSYSSTDSWTLAKIMVNLKDEEILELLKSYRGSASLLFTKPSMRNTLFVHRDPDRELFCYHETDNQLYISSIEESLYAIGGNNETVRQFKGHTVYKIVKGKIVKTWSTEERVIIKEPETRPVTRQHSFKWESEYNDYFARNDVDIKRIEAPVSSNGFSYQQDAYIYNGHPYTGNMWINARSNEYCLSELDGFTEYWFVRGVMMRDEESFKKLKDLAKNNQGIFDVNIFSKKVFANDIAHYSKYPVKSGLYGVSSAAIFFAKEYHAELYKNNKQTHLSWTPLLSNLTYTISMRAGLLSSKVGGPSASTPTERKIAKITTLHKPLTVKDALRTAFKNGRITDISALYMTIQVILGKNDTTELYNDFNTEFVSLCEDDGVIDSDSVKGITDRIKYGPVNSIHDPMNTLLDLYNIYLSENDTKEVELEVLIARMQDTNSYYQRQSFIIDVDTCQYNTLEDLMLEYALDDRPETTFPILQAVALELNRLGIIENNVVVQMLKLTTGKIYEELKGFYDIHHCIAVDEEPSDCCTSDLTIGGRIWNAYTRAEYLQKKKKSEQSTTEVEELDLLKQRLATLLTEADEVVATYLQNKYGVSLTSIIEDYKVYVGN